MLRPFTETGGRPGDERGFLHKKILGAIGTIGSVLPIPGAGAISAVARRLVGSGGRPVVPQTFAPTRTFAGATPGGGRTGGNGCPSGTTRDPQGRGFCVSRTSALGQRTLGGTVVEGLYGPAFVPSSELRDVAVCPPGFALGKDDLCYDGLANRKRKYPRGRRPLLTGGDMNAISRAKRAGTRLANAKTDLVAIGMLKAAAPKRRKKKAIPCA